ncbi:3'(2'), 5'-bisphosphate nucleotidase [Desulfosalsimonas propionicica]|uniref:3'(2'),5'-bisphosphate nucleotidase CysQ n=1 Tax=Desulfosalsimonas propionicica TaxID=332175 RepID=A0A7W0HK58_9BACT|nr:3'(2'),5'-bisphosphate nucleotidase CysQ [Desulfosalsimonas propionicica]MBA2880895.1 3'(2'), 5'-bisphosphate nucleotidase [Desulfosalsimonas propionicica]
MTPADYLDKAVFAAMEAGAAALEVYEEDFEVEEKSDHSPLTLADRRAHEIIAARLKPLQIPVLSEEGRDIAYAERKNWPQLWIVDPLDGTKEFVKKNGEFTINIALVQNGVPMLGVVFVPVKDRVYFAAQGRGAFLADGSDLRGLEKTSAADGLISVSRRLPLADLPARPYTVMGSRSHASDALSAFVAEKRREHGDLEFISAGSSLKFCLVAEGRADLYPRTGPTMEWDTAAGQAVVEQAGGSVLEFESGKPLAYNKENLTNPWFIVYRTAKDG